jgi:hypothetical protein
MEMIIKLDELIEVNNTLIGCIKRSLYLEGELAGLSGKLAAKLAANRVKVEAETALAVARIKARQLLS